MFHRQSVRLRGFDYSQNAWYFVTICTQKRECLFGGISDGKMTLNTAGFIVDSVWHSLPIHHPVKLDTYQIMPNHFHGIIVIDHAVGALRATPLPCRNPSRISPISGTLSVVIRSFKSECTKQIRKTKDDSSLLVWQRGFYEHVIRTEIAYQNIKNYILDNPVQWDDDVYRK